MTRINRKFYLFALSDAGLGDLVEPMVWAYVEDIDR
jgi:hypothetical protein